MLEVDYLTQNNSVREHSILQRVVWYASRHLSALNSLRKDITKSKYLLLLLLCMLLPFGFVCVIRFLVTTWPYYNFTIYGNVTLQTSLLLSVWTLLTMLNVTSCFSTCSLLSVKKSTATRCTVFQNVGKLKPWWKQLTFTSIMIMYRVVYVVVCSYFVYWVWVHQLPWYIQISQTLPGLSILLEGVVQDVLVLFFTACPSALRLALNQWKEKFALRVKFLALLNFFLFVHALILLITVVVTKTTISTVLIQILALCEVPYRMRSIYFFYNTIRNICEVPQHILIAGQDHSVLCIKQCSQKKPLRDNRSICHVSDAETTYTYLPMPAKRPVLHCQKEKIE